MANEITLSGSLAVAKGVIASESLAVSGATANLTGQNYVKFSQSIGTGAGGTAIKLGGLATVGWVIIVNKDVTNYVSLLTATSGTQFAKIMPGEFALLRLDPGVTAPAALANTAACIIECLLVEI